MADIREIALLQQQHSARNAPPWARFASQLKLLLRRFVVLTSGTPLRILYQAVYRAHIGYALRQLRRFPGTRAVYLARGLASPDVVYGVSDIDLVTLGDWSDADHGKVVAAMQRLNRLSPLYDTTLADQVHQIPVVRNLFETDYSVQFRFTQGRRSWKLLFGADLNAQLPAVCPEKIPGGFYMEVRNWWRYFAGSAFGGGPLAVDEIFRNSICFKAVADIVDIQFRMANGAGSASRKEAVERAGSVDGTGHSAYLRRLLNCARRRFLRFDGDVIEETFRFLLPAIDAFHAELAATPLMAAIGDGVRIDATAAETLRTPAAQAHAMAIAEFARKCWPGYRGSYLTPSLSFLNMDDLLLIVDVDAARLPSAAQVRALCRRHAEAAANLRQRVSIYLRLDDGAFQLDILSPIELWHFLISPAAVPDVFAPEGIDAFRIDGAPRAGVIPRWTRFARDLVDEELAVRRKAMSKMSEAGRLMPSLVILRNLWRHLQLEVVQRSAEMGRPVIPLTPHAVCRALASWGVDATALEGLRDAYAGELEGRPCDAAALLRNAMPFFAQLV